MTTADEINLAIAVATIISALISLAVAIVTFQIVKTSRETVAVMRAQLEATSRPYIQITPTVRPMSTLLTLVIANAGATAARNLRLTFDRDFFFNAEEREDGNLRRFTAFTQSIESFSPKAEMNFPLGIGHQVFRNPALCPPKFSILAEYEYDGRRVTEETIVDLQPFARSAKPVDAVVERLDKLNENLEAIHAVLRRTDG